MNYEHIIVETRDRVGLVQLNRPKALNALNDKLMDELGAALLSFDADDGIGAMSSPVTTRRFAARRHGAMSTCRNMTFSNDYITRTCELLRRVRNPVIAAVVAFAGRV